MEFCWMINNLLSPSTGPSHSWLGQVIEVHCHQFSLLHQRALVEAWFPWFLLVRTGSMVFCYGKRGEIHEISFYGKMTIFQGIFMDLSHFPIDQKNFPPPKSPKNPWVWPAKVPRARFVLDELHAMPIPRIRIPCLLEEFLAGAFRWR